jgi:hypothetical protein
MSLGRKTRSLSMLFKRRKFRVLPYRLGDGYNQFAFGWQGKGSGLAVSGLEQELAARLAKNVRDRRSRTKSPTIGANLCPCWER